MNTKIGSVVAALAVFLSPGSVQAHHSFQVNFDSSKTVTLTGTLTKVDWINPHIELFLDVKGARGPVEDWVIVGSPPSFFLKSHISKSDFAKAIGQPVTLEAYRARDGTLYGHLLRFTLPGGKSMTVNPFA